MHQEVLLQNVRAQSRAAALAKLRSKSAPLDDSSSSSSAEDPDELLRCISDTMQLRKTKKRHAGPLLDAVLEEQKTRRRISRTSTTELELDADDDGDDAAPRASKDPLAAFLARDDERHLDLDLEEDEDDAAERFASQRMLLESAHVQRQRVNVRRAALERSSTRRAVLEEVQAAITAVNVDLRSVKTGTVLPIKLELAQLWGTAAKTICERLGLDRERVQFLFDKLPLDDARTVEDHGVLDRDCIDMVVEADFSTSDWGAAATTGATPGDASSSAGDEADGERILLNFRPRVGDAVPLRVALTTPLARALGCYAQAAGVDASSIVLHFDGDIVDLNKSARDLRLEDEDLLDVQEKRA